MAINLHEGHRQRVKKEFLQNGFNDSTPDHKILELLLFYSVPRKDTNEIAHNLIEAFGSFSGVFNAKYEDLLKVEGVGAQTASLIKLILPVAKRYLESENSLGITFKNREDVAKYIMHKYIGDKKEIAMILCLDNKHKLICTEILGEGELHTVNVSVRKIVELALKHHASSVVLVHNHPNGFAVASKEDCSTTIKIHQALLFVGVKLYDHIIVGGGEYSLMSNLPDFKFVFKD